MICYMIQIKTFKNVPKFLVKRLHYFNYNIFPKILYISKILDIEAINQFLHPVLIRNV